MRLGMQAEGEGCNLKYTDYRDFLGEVNFPARF